MLSQFTTLGIQLSVLKETSQHHDQPKLQLDFFISALFSVIVISLLFVLLLILCSHVLSFLFPASEILQSFFYVVPGLFFFSLNKTFFAFFNGMNFMRFFAFMQTTRALLLVIFTILLRHLSSIYLPLIFTLSEAILFIGFLFFFLFKFSNCTFRNVNWSLCKKALNHGRKAIMGNAISEINTRLDVIMLSFFVNTYNVGLYSFGAMFADGFQLFITVITNNINPLISRYYYKMHDEFTFKIKNGINKCYLYLAPIIIISILCYPLIINMLNLDPAYLSTWAIFSIIMIGRLLAAGYLPYQMILNQIGFPGSYSLLLLYTFLINVVGNLLFIPQFGIYGAAFATALSIISLVFILKKLVKTKISVAL